MIREKDEEYENLKKREYNSGIRLLGETNYRFLDNTEYRADYLLDIFSNIDKYSKDTLINILYYNHKSLFNYNLLVTDCRENMQKLFTNPKFLDFLLISIGKCDLDNTEIKCLNRIIYDFLFRFGFQIDMETYSSLYKFNTNTIDYKMMNIANLINKVSINDLMSFGLDSFTAAILAIIGNSNFLISDIVSRINIILCFYKFNNMNIEYNIECIYKRLFGVLIDNNSISIDNYYLESHNLIYIFIDLLLNNNYKEMITRNYSEIINVILKIINNSDIYTRNQVLYNYGFKLKHMYSNIESTTNLIHLKDSNYYNIKESIKALEIEFPDTVFFV